MRLTKSIWAVLLLTGVLCLVLPTECPAPLIWRPGEGWSWEHGGMTPANNPKDQLALGKKLQGEKNYGDAISAFRRVIRRWPTSSSVPAARVGLAECLSAIRYYYKSYKEYQLLIEKNPNTDQFDLVLQREYEIGNLFMAGERDKAWGIRWFPDREKAVEIYGQIVKNGPYSKIAPQAQYRIGMTRLIQKEYLEAVHAFEKVLERYPNDPLAESAQFQIGDSYRHEAAHAEYDQNAANQAISGFTDFLVRYPKSAKAPVAEQFLNQLKLEQARGLFRIGEFYEKNKQIKAALIYYNDVIEHSPRSTWGTQAKNKVVKLTPQKPVATAKPAVPAPPATTAKPEKPAATTPP